MRLCIIALNNVVQKSKTVNPIIQKTVMIIRAIAAVGIYESVRKMIVKAENAPNKTYLL